MKDKCNPEWEKMFANEDTHKEFISETYRQLIQLSIKDTDNPRHKRAKHRNRCFLEEDIHTAIRHLRTFSASLILTHRGNPTRYYLTQVRTAISKYVQK